MLRWIFADQPGFLHVSENALENQTVKNRKPNTCGILKKHLLKSPFLNICESSGSVSSDVSIEEEKPEDDFTF